MDLRRARARSWRLAPTVWCTPARFAFLKRVRETAGGDAKVLAVVLAPECLGQESVASGLMRPDERVRVLRAMQPVDGATIVRDEGDLCRLAQAAPEALWAVSTTEGDVPDGLLNTLETCGVRLEKIDAGAVCTTAELLERMAR